MEAAQRREERAALRRHRELVKQAQRDQRERAKENAANEVAVYENYLDVLVSVHKDCGEQWNWRSVSIAPAPPVPAPTNTGETATRQRLDDYKPGFFARLFGGAKKRRAELEDDVQRAIAEDRAEHQRALAAHQKATELWDFRRQLAGAVLQRNVAAYRKALEHIDPFSELGEFKTRVEVVTLEPDVLALNCHLEDEDLVPKEELKLTAGGKASEKQMAAGKYWALHQDYVCSCALRAARESLAALPVSRVIVNVQGIRMDTSTGHLGVVTLLAINFTRPELQRINMETIDPSDSLKNFHHRMKFKKSSGFEPVEPITADEQWVTT